MANTNIIFAGFGRMRDQLILAAVYDRITSQDKNEIETSFQSYLTDAISRFSPGQSVKFMPWQSFLIVTTKETFVKAIAFHSYWFFLGSREKRSYNGGTMYLVADEQICCIYAVAVRGGKTYPERVAFTFLAEFVKLVSKSEQGRSLNLPTQQAILTKNFLKPLKELIEKYDKPGNIDKTSEVQGKVDEVKGIMQDNISKVLANQTNLEDLEAKTDTLNINAQEFAHSAEAVHKKMWWDRIKVNILIGIVCAAVLAYLIVVIVNLVK